MNWRKQIFRMPLFRDGWCWQTMGTIIAIALLYAGWPAIVQADPSSFCSSQVVRDYKAPFSHMPDLPSPPKGKALGFGPGTLRMYPLQGSPIPLQGDQADGQVLVGSGDIGYSFSLTRPDQKAQSLGWELSASVPTINSRGIVRRVVWRARRLVRTLSQMDGLELRYRAPARPRFYRFDLHISNREGKTLGRFGEYSRVVRPSIEVKLTMQTPVVHVGEKSVARIENLSPQAIMLGVGFVVERFDSGVWMQSNLAPTGSVPRRARILNAGESGPCINVVVPAGQALGRYRFRKSFGLQFPRPGPNYTRSAEFEITANS